MNNNPFRPTNKQKGLYITLGIVFIVIGVILVLVTGETIVQVLGGILVVGGIMSFVSLRHSSNFAKKVDVEKYVRFYDSEETLKILQRDPLIQSAIAINAGRDATLVSTPDKLVYTGATVGGVTTGGFHVEKGGTYLQAGKKNGTFYFSYVYTLVNEIGYIGFIELSDLDFKEAKKDNTIKRLIVKEKDKKDNQSGKNLLDVHSLSEADAYAVKNWICMI